MQFTVPQFIEREPKIVGPFTFKQFIFIGIAGSICIFFYFTAPFSVFIIAAIVLMGGAFALAFLKVGKTTLPALIKNFFGFFIAPKIYLWKKKFAPPKVLKKELPKKEKEEIRKGPVLKVAGSSRLRKISTTLETKSK